ncbi:hypothetical protein HGA64_05050, partial [Candidatus Falkowbacteria bacterium]|nr:hypothetical protein [Candidatus Falkowbacteria bacterium]
LLAAAIIFFSLILIAGLTYAWYAYSYQNRVFKGVTLGKIDISGYTAEELRQLLNSKINYLDQNGIEFRYNKQAAKLYPIISSSDSDVAYSLIDIDQEQTIADALALAQQGGWLVKFKTRLGAMMFGHPIELSYAINQNEIKKFISKNFSNLELPGQDAKLVFNPHPTNDAYFKIEPEKAGQAFDLDQALTQLSFRLFWLDFSPVKLRIVNQLPSIRKQNIANADKLATEILNLAPLTLKAASSSWTVDKSQLGYWLGLKKATTNNSNLVILGLNRDATKKYLTDKIAKDFDKPEEDAKFNIVNGRVTAFQSSKDGQTIDQDASLNIIENGLIEQKQSVFELPVKKLISQTASTSTDNLGVTEIIGTGHSSFSGSPTNRRKNIRTGANYLSGLLIKPGQTFSVVSNLGSIDAAGGYFPELVIKGNKTLPEFGGGLCQVGTTMFRAALDSGLPIVERRNHSYRVGYYEPAGTDATIYDPSPDLKFLNDTNNYILIQSRIQGNDLYFDFWGTRDGRVATRTYPTIYNIVKPKPAKIIETTTLKPGVKKCSEKAHNGADAFFDYTVTYASGEIKKKKFSSHYVPWQEVCLIGVKSLTASTTPATASSSPAATNSAKPTTSSSSSTTKN